MRYISVLSFIFFGLLFLPPAESYAQWQPDVRLTDEPSASYTSLNQSWCIASSGTYVHAVWFDGRDGNDEIYYKRSTDEGVTWGADIRLTNDAAVSSYPSIAVSGTDVRVVWQDNRSDGRYEFYYKRSTDDGATWGVDTRLTDNAGESRYPSIATSGSTSHLVWSSWRDARHELYYKRTVDGSNWGADLRLTENDTNISTTPSIAVHDLGVHVVWVDERDGNKEIYYKRSINGGISWGSDIRLSDNPAVSQKPCIAVSPLGEVHIVWVDNRDGDYEIYYKGSMDGGANWGADTRLTNHAAASLHPSVAVSDSLQGRVHVVWMDYLEGSNEVFYKRSGDAGLSWESNIRLTNAANGSEYPSVVGLPRGGAHVLWQDRRDGNYEIYYKRNPTDNIDAIDMTGSGLPEKIALEQNYPNPFNPATTIRYSVPSPQFVTLGVYDILGCEIALLVSERKQAGFHEVDFNTTHLPTGVYFYRFQAGDFSETRKLILVR